MTEDGRRRTERRGTDDTPVEHPRRGPGSTGQGGRSGKDEHRGKRRLRHRTSNVQVSEDSDIEWEGTEGKGQKTEDRGQTTEDGRRRFG
jgi:hypothetical protein